MAKNDGELYEEAIKQASFTQVKAFTGCRSNGAHHQKTTKRLRPKIFWVIYEPQKMTSMVIILTSLHFQGFTYKKSSIFQIKIETRIKSDY